MRQLALAIVTPGNCRTAVCNVGQHYPDEISGLQNWCTALKYSNRSLRFGVHLHRFCKSSFQNPGWCIHSSFHLSPYVHQSYFWQQVPWFCKREKKTDEKFVVVVSVWIKESDKESLKTFHIIPIVVCIHFMRMCCIVCVCVCAEEEEGGSREQR